MEQKAKIEDIYSFYRKKKEEHLIISQKLKRLIYNIGTIRLILVAGMFVSLWLCRENGLPFLIATAAIFFLLFFLLVIYHTKLHVKRTYEEGIISLCENELKALDYDFSAFDGGGEHIDSQHPFSLDLDLFGENSLFQSVNRTVTQPGRDQLISLFKKPSDNKDMIMQRQQAVQEISNMNDFRHDFYVNGKTSLKKYKDITPLFSYNEQKYEKLSGSIFYKIMIWLVPALWVILITGCALDHIGIGAIGIYLVVSIITANMPAKKIQKLYVSVNKMENVLKTYSELMEHIENGCFNSNVLQANRQKLICEGTEIKTQIKFNQYSNKESRQSKKIPASYVIKKLSRYIGALDQRFGIMGLIVNLLYMRDTRQAMNIEMWKEKYSGHLRGWFDALGVFDEYCSLGTFAYNNPEYTYPAIADSYFEMKGKGLGHPLIHRDKCVCNDISITGSKYFIIVTGANMAGKSTYLRTIGVNFMFSCMGLPVFAKELTVYPAHLVTSLRTADSLISNESYFFAELKRLKMIIDRLNEGEKLFIVLDEILKGTNSVDKQKGSIALIKQLINKGTCGIIATHDLLLGTLSDVFPDNVQNKRFEADINNEELSFTYKIRDGIAQNMNATFLMKKMGIFENK